MAPDTRTGNHSGDDFDRQVARLAARLRDEGQAPARDLWPDIDAALDRQAPASTGRRRTGNGRTFALAASVLLLVGMGYIAMQQRHGPIGATNLDAVPAVVRAGGPVVSGLQAGAQAVDRALHDLQAALDAAPEDANLPRLILMIHQSRARLLRSQIKAETGAMAPAGL